MKISIIIPVYNSEKYLRQCLDSVLAQTYTDFEALLIDDGSTDGSGAICDEYAARDARFKVFHKENGGVSSARNLGIDNAQGEWICFVDSDDCLLKNYVQDLVLGAKKEPVGLVIQGFIKVKGKHQKSFDLGEDIIECEDYGKLFITKRLQNFGFPFAKLFKKSIVKDHQISFPQTYSIAEDLAFLLHYLKFCRKVKFQKQHNYLYLQNANSLSNHLREPSVYFNRYTDIKNILKFNYQPIYQDIFLGATKKYEGFYINVASSLFQMILSLYFFPLSKEQREWYFSKLEKDDLELLSTYKERFRNPVFQMALNLLQNNKINFADIVFNTFFQIRNNTLKMLGKSVEYPFKK